ncbi:MAG: TldD/PmbA family protein [Actinobacteria bacterium]|nr:TldD/PmbA family protein [Actinomycetota bacterium]MCA1721539.1 TldD/PmbA family protein [Actinomycetota bacterium]
MSDVVERALGLSRADGCVVIVRESSSVDLRWANNTLTTNGSGRSRSVTVISVMGESVGVRSASVVDDLEALVRASEQAAREAGPAEDAGPLVEGGAAADFSDVAETCTTAVFERFARELGDSFEAARGGGRRLFGYATHDITTTWLGASTGLRLRHVQPTGYVELTGKTDRPGGSTWVGQHTVDWSDIQVPELDAEVQRRLGWAARSVDLPAGRYDTILPPSAVADLMVYLYWTATGRDAAEGRSVFSRPGGGTRVGEQVGPAALRMWSDPTDRTLPTLPFMVATGSSSTASIFDNGLALPASDWVVDGALSALVQTRATARQVGVPVTPLVDNLLLDAGGTRTTEEMVASTERGLLLTCLWYIRVVDPETLLLTGLTRDGVYLVEGGEVTGVVNNFRFNESPLDLLGRLSEVGASVPTLPREWSDYFTWVRMPAVRVPDFNMSSVSQAS